MLLSVKGMGQGFISFNGIQDYIYNGNPQFTRTALIIDYGSSDDDSPITVYSYSGNSFLGIPYGPSPNKPINAGNYTVTATVTFNDISGSFNSLPVSFTIAKATPTLTVTNSSLTYTANTQSATVSSSVPGSRTNINYNGLTIEPTNAGTYTITADFLPTDVANFNSLTNESAGSFIINRAPITISNIIVTKVYDGTPTVSLISNESTGSLLEDNIVGVAAPTNFSNKIVANNYSLTVTFSLTSATGKESNYYILGGNQKSVSNGSITAKALSISASSVASRAYNATKTVGVITKGTLTGFIGTETVTATAAGTDYASANAGSYTSTISYTLVDGTNGGLASNYSLANEVASGTITQKPITITVDAGQTKVYGAADPATYTYGVSVSLTGLATLNGTLTRASGETVGNYAIQQNNLTTANNPNYTITFVGNNFVITPAPVNNTGTTKAYDLPNAFTPNGDGKNDLFKIIVNDPTRVNLISFQIYNRNGILMFSTNKISEGWDGRYKGIVQDMGIYFVKLITSENGLDTRSIYLLK
jgi:gliding motility-associated-like protein